MAEVQLLAHYLAADYRVGGDAGFLLKVGVYSASLQALYQSHGVVCSAFLTAWNPRSRRVDAADNQRAQQQLEALLQQGGHVCLAGRGEDPAGHWPAEEGLLVLGISESDACQLGREFDQNALLYAGPDAIPRLVWLQLPAAMRPSGR